MEEQEQTQARLDHVRTVKPIVEALRTISMGSWRSALDWRRSLGRYEERLSRILVSLVPHLPAPARQRREERVEKVLVVIVGSERGLVGAFNQTLAQGAQEVLAEQEAAGALIETVAFGTRLQRILEQRYRPADRTRALSVSALPSFDLANQLSQHWLLQYERDDLDAVDLIYNAYRGMAKYELQTVRLIPPSLPVTDGEGKGPWPPPIIETDPLSLYIRVVRQWTAISFHRILLDSAAAEHSTRYQLMQSASRTTERLISELTLMIQAARRHEITQEMVELAVGAGLIGRRKENEP
ncbi:MAG: F0F1 ATP synthase subunit gamma [Anaerolineae bacterium]|jgi:F-type H+-transporting ATPase subunit gamma